LVVCTGCSSKISGKSIDKTIKATCQYLIKEEPEAAVGEGGDDWVVFALKKSGTDVAASDYYEAYYDDIRGYVKANRGVLSRDRYTAYERASLALWAIGKDPTDIEGYNLIKKADDYTGVTGQGVNAEIFALISSNYGDYKLKNEKRYLNDILKNQLRNGSFSLDKETEDVDMTSMAIQALSAYRNNKTVASAIAKGKKYLSAKQRKDGSYGNAESTAQVIIALGTLKEDPTADKDFVSKGHDLGDGLMEYWTGEAFSHKKGDEINMLATEQSLMALEAVKLSQQGKSIYEK